MEREPGGGALAATAEAAAARRRKPRPPDILLRANALAAKHSRARSSDGALRTAVRRPGACLQRIAPCCPNAARKRGEVDAALVVGLAKLDDCATLHEADAMLTRAEKMAVLRDARGLDRLAALERD